MHLLSGRSYFQGVVHRHRGAALPKDLSLVVLSRTSG